MKWKLVSAFATGALLASGIVYLAVRQPVSVEEPKRVTAVQPSASMSPPSPLPAPPRTISAVAARKPHPVVREKPSPMPPPIRREKPVAIAKYVPPPAPVQTVSLPPAKAEAPNAPSVTLAAGTLLPVRIGENLSSARNQPGDSFSATLTQPLVIDGWVIAERGARVEGRVVDKGGAHLGISIVRLALSDGQNVPIHTELYVGNVLEIPMETRVSFKVQDSLTITERLN
ncbi:MAG: hypothetical protein ACLPWF_13625 [Bryobacteraceae bacterium]